MSSGGGYASTVLSNHVKLVQGTSKTFKCQFCQKKEYPHSQSLSRHKKDCEMNPDKKRKTEAEEEADTEMYYIKERLTDAIIRLCHQIVLTQK